MGKAKVFIFAVIVLACSSIVVFAQEPAEEKKEPAAQEKTAAKEALQERMGTMAMQMMGSMQRQMVATSDGGVIVLAGEKLVKYDKDLNLVKEVEIKREVELRIDAGSVQDMIKNMKEKYGK
ncbi:MAG: hypothetical protein PHW54_04745 [Candidatus Omnitrophica bacterium]|jgi:outer membrane lipoprotein-sorting protein|nr:hypothetical protein [Candidatus Omnitrophota bacterium]